MSIITYVVEGSTCGGCADKVAAKVQELPGVAEVNVNLASNGMTVSTHSPVNIETFKQAVEEAGYRLAS